MAKSFRIETKSFVMVNLFIVHTIFSLNIVTDSWTDETV